MMKKTLAILGAAALALAAEAKEINNFFDHGFPQLIPSVQKLERTGESYRLPGDLAIAAPEAAEREAKLAGSFISGRFGVCKFHLVPADAKAGMRLVLTEQGVPESPEGYALDISPAGIEIRSRDVRGLFYGVQTFGNIVRNNVVTTLPGCKIADWPDLRIRGLFLNLRELKNQDVGAFCGAIRALAGLKYNTLVLEFADNLPMKDNPFTLRKETLTEESLQRIIDTARECHCEIVPHLQVLSHDDWMRMHPEYWEKVSARVKGTPARLWDSSACPEKPLTHELTEYTIRETVRLIRPKQFNICMDEIILCEWRKCNKCPGGHTLEQFIREVKHYTEFVADLGVVPWIYHDTFCGKTFSKEPFDGHKALDVVPKQTVFNMWSYRANPTVQFFDMLHKRGFATVGVSYVSDLENVRSMPLACKKYRTLGSILTYWGYLRGSFHSHTGIDPFAAAGTILAAEYQWKCSDRGVNAWSYDPAWELRRRLGGAPLRRRGSSYENVSIANVCNAKLGADARFPKLGKAEVARIARELAGTPESFKLEVTDDGRIAAAVLSAGNDGYPATRVTIPVDGYCHGLTFLMTGSLPNAPLKFKNKEGRLRLRFFPRVATLKINYAEGKPYYIPVRCGMEINHWNALASGMRCRMVIRGNAADDANYAIYAFDWNNPRPKAKIRSVEFTTEKLGVKEDDNVRIAPALLAVSANVPKGIGSSDAALGELKEFNTAAKKKQIRKLSAVNFTRGRGRFESEGDFVRPVKTTVVSDPGSPSGKALKVVLPPVKPGSRPARAIVDVPVPKKLDKLGSVAFHIRCDKPGRIQRSGVYFMDRKITRYNVAYNMVRSDTDKWQYFEIPFDMMAPVKQGHGVTVENAATIRVTVWLYNGDDDVTVWFGPIAASPDKAEFRFLNTVKIE